jgi:hypothetical protein
VTTTAISSPPSRTLRPVAGDPGGAPGDAFAAILSQQQPAQPADEPRGTKPRGEKDEHAHDADQADPAVGAGAAGAPAVPDAPVTIHNFNQKLLLQGGGKTPGTPAPLDAASPSPAGVEAAAPRARAREAASGTVAPRDEARPTAPAHEGSRPSKPGAGEPTRAGEAERGVPRDAENRGGSSKGDGQPGQTGSERGGNGGAWQAAVSRMMGPVARDASSFRAVAPSGSAAVGGTGAVGGAQAPRNGATILRPVVAPGAATRSTPARGEVLEAQISKGVAAALERGSGTLTLRLKPEALGQVNIRVTMKDGAVTARFEARTPEARELLEQSTPELQRSLEAAGLRVERLETTLVPEAQGDAGDLAPGSDGSARDAGGQPESERRGPDGDHPERLAQGALGDGTAPDESHWITIGLDTIA